MVTSQKARAAIGAALFFLTLAAAFAAYEGRKNHRWAQLVANITLGRSPSPDEERQFFDRSHGTFKPMATRDAIEHAIRKLYRKHFGRDILVEEADGLNAQISFMEESGMKFFLASLLHQDEFYVLAGKTNEEFINRLYQTLFQSAPYEKEKPVLEYWLRWINHGSHRLDVTAWIVSSEAYFEQWLREQYLEAAGKEIDDSELTRLMSYSTSPRGFEKAWEDILLSLKGEAAITAEPIETVGQRKLDPSKRRYFLSLPPAPEPIISGDDVRSTLSDSAGFAKNPLIPTQRTVRISVVEESLNPEFIAKSWAESPLLREDSRYLCGDVNQDGRSDVLLGSKDSSTWYAFVAGNDGFTQQPWASFSKAERWTNPLLADFNGDGAVDLALFSLTSNSWWLAENSRSAQATERRWAQLPWKQDSSSAVAADFTGDGTADIAMVFREHGSIWVLTLNPDGSSALASMGSFLGAPASNFEILPANIILDALSDLVFVAEGSKSVTFANSLGSLLHLNRHYEIPLPQGEAPSKAGLAPLQVIHSAPGRADDLVIFRPDLKRWLRLSLDPRADRKAYDWVWLPPGGDWSSAIIADFNGDSIPDLVSRAPNAREWLLAKGTATGAPDRVFLEAALDPGKSWGSLIAGDFNGDGLSDIASLQQGSSQLWVALSKISMPSSGADFELNSTSYHFAGGEPVSLEVPTEAPLRARVKHASFAVTERPPGRATITIALHTAAESADGPSICVGANQDSASPWGYIEGVCPDATAFVAVEDPAGTYSGAGSVPVSGACCKLPMHDMLTSQQERVPDLCPAGFIATGSLSDYACSGCDKFLQCTKINTERYKLGPETPGIYWGAGVSRGGEGDKISKSSIPLSLRYAIGRKSFRNWDSDGCIGAPPGALLVGKRGKHCRDFQFAELQYRGAPGDPPEGTPVKMFPECSGQIDPYTSKPRCVN